MLLAPTGFFSICWCWLRIVIRLTWTGIGTTSFWAGRSFWWFDKLVGSMLLLDEWLLADDAWWWWWWPARFVVMSAAFTRFHLARRFWNHILIWTSERRNWWAIWDLSVRLRYFLAWNSRSNSISWWVEKAVRRRRLLLLTPPLLLWAVAASEPSEEVTADETLMHSSSIDLLIDWSPSSAQLIPSESTSNSLSLIRNKTITIGVDTLFLYM